MFVMNPAVAVYGWGLYSWVVKLKDGTSQKDHFGMSFFVGLGNKADMDFCEFIAYANNDEHTKCVSVYIEELDSPEAFVEDCQRVDKPIVAIKVGGSKIGVKAAFAHTTSENPNADSFYDDIFKEAGAIRALSGVRRFCYMR